MNRRVGFARYLASGPGSAFVHQLPDSEEKKVFVDMAQKLERQIAGKAEMAKLDQAEDHLLSQLMDTKYKLC